MAGAAAALAIASQASAQTGPAPALTYAFTVRVELAPPVEQGVIDGGRRRFVPIVGGTISGPRLTGTVMPGGGDWQTIYPGGYTRLDARYFLKAADGTAITTEAAPSSASSSAPVGSTEFGSATAGRYRGLDRASAICSTSSGK